MPKVFGGLLSVDEAASRLGLKPSTVRKMVLQRRIDVVRPSRRAVRIPSIAVQRILEDGYRPAIADGEAAK